jgi:hypothetical protein
VPDRQTHLEASRNTNRTTYRVTSLKDPTAPPEIYEGEGREFAGGAASSPPAIEISPGRCSPAQLYAVTTAFERAWKILETCMRKARKGNAQNAIDELTGVSPPSISCVDDPDADPAWTTHYWFRPDDISINTNDGTGGQMSSDDLAGSFVHEFQHLGGDDGTMWGGAPHVRGQERGTDTINSCAAFCVCAGSDIRSLNIACLQCLHPEDPRVCGVDTKVVESTNCRDAPADECKASHWECTGEDEQDHLCPPMTKPADVCWVPETRTCDGETDDTNVNIFLCAVQCKDETVVGHDGPHRASYTVGSPDCFDDSDPFANPTAVPELQKHRRSVNECDTVAACSLPFFRD